MQIPGGSSGCGCACLMRRMADISERFSSWFNGLGWPFRLLSLATLGVLAGLGQAPADAWYVTLLALAGAFWLYARQGWSFWFGWALGLGYFGFSLRWIVEPFLVDAARDGWMAPFALSFMAAGAAVFWGVAARLGRGNPWCFALFLAAAEVVRSLALTGFPWALLGHVWIDTPIAQVAAFGGPHLLTALLLAAGVGLAQFRTSPLQAGGPVLALAFLWVALAPGPVTQSSTDLPLVRLVQPNVPQAEKWDPILGLSHFERMLEFTAEQSDRPDLIVWPETAVTSLYEFAQPNIDLMAEAAQGVPLVSGIQRRAEEMIYHNALFIVGRGGSVEGLYDKQHLVPFGEFFPGGEFAARLGLRGFASSQGFGFTAGQGPDILQIEGIGPVRPLICYEGIFAEEIRADADRPRVMILITNDAWFGQGAGPRQHLAQARLRAIEQGVPMVRVANTGISAMIDAKGRIIAQMGMGESGYLDVPLPPVANPTFYGHWGDMPFLAVLLVLCLSVLLTFRAKFD